MSKSVAVLLNWFVNAIFRIEVINPENLPKDGACLVCLNHISAWDPLVVGMTLKRKVRFLAKSELMKIPLVGWFLKSIGTIPIKRGASDVGAIKASLRTLKDGEALGIFPTGTRERKHKNAPVKSGAALIAVKSGAPVVPVCIKTEYKLFKPVKIIVGEPVSFAGRCESTRPSQEELSQFSNEIYSTILNLGDVR